MCPGFGGVKPHIDHYAELFAEAGFSVLNYDQRCFGTSEGEPRQEMQPYKQMGDFRAAITFAQSQPEFDADLGFGVWGSSFSGGLAIITAANDPRVKCVVAQIPNVSGCTRRSSEPISIVGARSTGRLARLGSRR
jgi:uncharacterized protein